MGGMERASSNLANYFASQGYKVKYVAMFRLPRFFTLTESIQYAEPEQTFSTLPILQTVLRIRKETRSYKPDTVLVFNKFFSALTVLALVGCGVPIYISERSSPLYKWKTKIRIFNRLAFFINHPSGIIAQTSIAATYQRKYFGNTIPIAIIHNATKPVILIPGIIKKKQILAVGRLTDYLKGFDRLIEAFSQVKADDWKLVIAGGDEQGAHLKMQARALGIANDRIEFLGQVKDMDLLYQQSEIFVIPSRSEGFPNALCEAMTAGVACISFDFIAGPADLIEDGVNGYLVKEGDIQALTDKIQFVIENADVRKGMGANAAKIIDKLREEVIGEKFLDFIFP